MVMRRGTRVDGGYATVADGGEDYRKIAEKMTEQGFKMNHSSARNHFLGAMKGLAEDALRHHKLPVDEDSVGKLARSPMFQDAVRDFYETHSSARMKVTTPA